MRRLIPVLITCAAVFLQDAAAQACGDKFLLLGRGVKFRRAYAAIYPALIVIYAPPQRHAAKAIRDPRLQSDLKLAGHRAPGYPADTVRRRRGGRRRWRRCCG